MTLMLDISRLMARRHFATPTGIDRFELSYAQWLLNADSKTAFIETGASGSWALRPDIARTLIEQTERRWATTRTTPDEARQLDAIVAAIEGRLPWQRNKGASPSASFSSRATDRARHAMCQVTRAWTPPPSDGTLIHVSHARLHHPKAWSWLEGRERGIFYVHDLIPLSHPEFVRLGEPERHLQRIRTVLRHAKLVLCNSRVTAATLDQLAQQACMVQPRSAVLPPGVNEAFLHVPGDGPIKTNHPYFVCLGTIEPRKNHALLLKLWRRLVERHGQSAPRLVMVGRRGWDNAELFKLLDRCGPLLNAVIELADLSDAPLARLVAGASALLAPSFVEGYGMPVGEALAVGTPVIASDITAHREIVGCTATLLDPLDGRDWLAAIEHHAARHGVRRTSHGRCVSRWSWADHFRGLERLMQADRIEVSTRRQPASRSAARPARWRDGPTIVFGAGG